MFIKLIVKAFLPVFLIASAAHAADTRTIPVPIMKPVMYTTTPSFSDYKVDSVIDGANFAGHYRAEVTSGCGTECRVLTIIDLNTGQVVHNKGYGSSGVEYYPDSRLLLLNPFNSHYNKIGSSHYKVKKFYRWNGKTLKLFAEEDWSESVELEVEGDNLDHINYLESPDVGGWKSVSYTEDGRVFKAIALNAEAASLKAYFRCQQSSNTCVIGVDAPKNWTVKVGVCQQAKYRFVSLAVSSDGKNFKPDNRLDNLSANQVKECKEHYSF